MGVKKISMIQRTVSAIVSQSAADNFLASKSAGRPPICCAASLYLGAPSLEKRTGGALSRPRSGRCIRSDEIEERQSGVKANVYFAPLLIIGMIVLSDAIVVP